jgi:hypothetical protein
LASLIIPCPKRKLCDDGDESHLAMGAFLRALDRLITGEKHIPLLGASSPINQTGCSGMFGLLGGARGPFLVAAAMVMWVLLAVGRWPLVAQCFRWHESYIIVGII